MLIFQGLDGNAGEFLEVLSVLSLEKTITKPFSRIWKVDLNGRRQFHGKSAQNLEVHEKKHGHLEISIRFTFPKTNTAPEIRPSQKESSIPTIHFQGLC